MKTVTRSVELVREGSFVAEVDVDLIDSDSDWAPFLSLDDAEKLDRVRAALRAGDVAAAGKLARVYELTPITG
jgi:hypothetical protein